MARCKPVVLMILDGWGYQENPTHNAIAAAHTPHWDEWWKNRPHMVLNASGTDVGLPHDQMGNSEVGHMHIGAGRIIYQDYTRINAAIESGEFQTNSVLLNLIQDTKIARKTLHVMGLLSEGGVHSHQHHLFAFLALCHQQDFRQVCLHLFLDGRDTPPQSALNNINELQQQLERYPVGKIASITGRYYAMDRDNRWDRVLPVYELLTEAKSNAYFIDAETAIKHYYATGIHDEFIPPTLIGVDCPVKDGDSLFFFNFRSDRARQLSYAFLDDKFAGFPRKKIPQLTQFVTMTRYAKQLTCPCVFPSSLPQNTLGEVLSNQGLSQLRIAETEKYAHVTFFLNGGSETVFMNEDRILIPSPRVTTYDLCPEMSARIITSTIVDAIQTAAYDVIICNYANADMVGHTGDFDATVQSIECLDDCMGQVWQALSNVDGQLLITADHGNAEAMYDEKTRQAHTAHTCEPVPLLYIGGDWEFKQGSGSLIDIAPTVLTLLGIKPPTEMTGTSLLVEKHAGNN